MPNDSWFVCDNNSFYRRQQDVSKSTVSFDPMRPECPFVEHRSIVACIATGGSLLGQSCCYSECVVGPVDRRPTELPVGIFGSVLRLSSLFFGVFLVMMYGMSECDEIIKGKRTNRRLFERQQHKRIFLQSEKFTRIKKVQYSHYSPWSVLHSRAVFNLRVPLKIILPAGLVRHTDTMKTCCVKRRKSQNNNKMKMRSPLALIIISFYGVRSRAFLLSSSSPSLKIGVDVSKYQASNRDDDNETNHENTKGSFQDKVDAFLDTPFFDPKKSGSLLKWFADLVESDYELAETLYAGLFFVFLVIGAQELLRMQMYGDAYVPFQHGVSTGGRPW